MEKDFPQLVIHSVQEMPHGWRNYVFLINNKLIVRFPKNVVSEMGVQKKVLDKLAKSISYKIPTIHYLDPKRCYTVYPAILACSYSLWDFQQFTSEEKSRAAVDIADFLYQMHGVYALEELQELGIARFDYAKEVRDISEESAKFATLSLPRKVSKLVESQAEVAKHHLSQNHEEVLLHNDLHAGNIILDCDNKRLHGVIDFDDIKIGHFQLDFASLIYSLPADISQSIVQIYADRTGREVGFDYALAIAVDYVSSNLIKYPNSKDLWQKSLETLEYLADNLLTQASLY